MTNEEVILKYLKTSEEIGCEQVILKGFDVRILNSYIEALLEQKKQLIGLVKLLNKDIINLTKEVEEIEL